MSEQDIYTVTVGCENCWHVGRVRVRRGLELSAARCPNCDTRRLVKVLWIWPWQRRFRRNAYAPGAP
jgi:DNA-directed RNA polymerase subunit RPC12/RpoP